MDSDYVCDNCDNEDQAEFSVTGNGVTCDSCGWSERVTTKGELAKINAKMASDEKKKQESKLDFAALMEDDD